VILPIQMLGQRHTPAGNAGKAKPPSQKPGSLEDFARHYEAARTFQISGDQERAASEYVAFLGGALGSAASTNSRLGNSDKAAVLFDEALRLAPANSAVRLDYGRMRLQQGDFAGAHALGEEVLKDDPENVKAHALLGQALFSQGAYKDAREHLEEATATEPAFDVAYLLGVNYLKLGDFVRARLVFDDLITGFGDTARMHMMLGLAYKEGGWEALDNAIQELKKALAKDSRTAKAHYLIALAYMDRDGESGFALTAAELREELKVNPDDSRSHYLLGYIAMKQHDAKTAESELLRASQLEPKNPDPLIYLGQIYSDADRDTEAEAMLRKAIILVGSSSTTDYLVGRAHYVLGRLILKAGKKEEGEKELLASQQIRDRMNRPDAARDTKIKSDPELANISQATEVARPSPPSAMDPQAAEKLRTYVSELKPAIADAYNNLGVMKAGHKDFTTALEYFRRAGEWNPGLETLDRNWGMAAFYAAQYQDAVPPLTRQLQKQPDDVRIRAALGLSVFMVQDFNRTLETLKPIQDQVDTDPGLAYAFAVSLVKVGNYDEGVRRLKILEEGNPNSADLHTLLGSAFADQHEYDTAVQEYRKSLAIDPNQTQTHYLTGLALIRSGKPNDAVDEFRIALKLNSSDVSAKYHLAFSLIQLHEVEEAQTLLREVIEQDPKRGDAYYELGKLQLEKGDTKGAVSSLETGIKVSPEADYIHYQLAMAYRRESRKDDAEREIKLYQTLKNRQRGRGDAPQSN
jgi:tetratricopeptide (TPR) repeat protein